MAPGGGQKHEQTTRLVEVAVGSRGLVAVRDAPSYKTNVSNTMFILKLCTKKKNTIRAASFWVLTTSTAPPRWAGSELGLSH